ncbi:MAG: hypothetical protein EOP45_03480 [Sphingobacteriaceae bacterium]|nr:MAG: hypothetical protein EOP45_03480 [Sphingobacteriaceae bacterium]
MSKSTEQIQEYKNDQKKRMSSFFVGKKDPIGNEITFVYILADEFVIYEIKTINITESLKVRIDTLQEEDLNGIITNFAGIRADFTEFKGIIYKIQNYSSYKSIAAHLISHALNGQVEDAKNKFAELNKTINFQYAEQFNYRLYYLITALCFVLLNIIVSVIIYLTHILDSSLHLRDLIFSVAGGSIGGFISLSRKLKEMIFEKDVKRYLFVAYSLERIFISMLAAIVAYSAIQSNLIFGVIKQLKHNIFGYIIFSIAAGFSETLVPNLLIRFEDKPTKQHQ